MAGSCHSRYLTDKGGERIVGWNAELRISEFDYDLPSELIAQRPATRRDQARLMVVHRRSGRVEHCHFHDLNQFFSDQDLLVLNDSRVFPARLFGNRLGYSGRIEVLLVRRYGENVWEALVNPSKKITIGSRLIFQPGGLEGDVLANPHPSRYRLRFDYRGDFWQWIEKLGKTPLPPYIRRPIEPGPKDRERYQTVFARQKGSIAAPTAGMHFTRLLLRQIPHCSITLHVGYGTFKPVSTPVIEEHSMEPEYYEISLPAANRIKRQLDTRSRVIAVGTTTTRVVEHVFLHHGTILAERGWTDLFIYPGFTYRVLRGLITNFHLPKSSLLLLVCAFAGKKLIKECYRQAVERRYRFYSYGDAMLIL